MAELLAELAPRDGVHTTSIPGVRVGRQSKPAARHHTFYEPTIIFIAQGRKCGYVGGEVYRYDADNYLALAIPVPAECEIDATSTEPLLALAITVEPTMLAEILVNLDEPVRLDGPVPRGICANPLTPVLRDAAVRLLEHLRSPLDSRILGPQTVREILYRVLVDNPGSALRAVAARDDLFMRVARVLRQIHEQYAKQLDIEHLARAATMSVSTFHHNFKVVTGTSPLQYVKSVRLHQARVLMGHMGHNASTAAAAVGYESASQFGREFKRMFGTSPREDAAAVRRQRPARTASK